MNTNPLYDAKPNSINYIEAKILFINCNQDVRAVLFFFTFNLSYPIKDKKTISKKKKKLKIKKNRKIFTRNQP